MAEIGVYMQITTLVEYVFDEVVLLQTKIYGIINKKYEYVKVKRLKNPVKFKELNKSLKAKRF